MNKKYLNFIILLFIILNLFLFEHSIKAEPVLNFGNFKSYKLNSIVISNLNYQKKASIQIFAYTYDKRKILVFYSDIRYYSPTIKCYFYSNPNFEKINLILNLDSQTVYSYDFKINPNKDAEKDLLNFTFYQQYNYEIINLNQNNAIIKIPNEYNQAFYSLLANTYIKYFDKKKPDSLSILLFVMFSILYITALLILNDKKKRFLILLFLTLIFSSYAVLFNNQNLILKTYMTNILDPKYLDTTKDKKQQDDQNIIGINIKLDVKNDIEYFNFLSFKLIKQDYKIITIRQQTNKMAFFKIFYQNEKIPLDLIFPEIEYFKSLPEYFCIVYQNYQYYIKQNKILLFGKVLNEQE